MLHKRFFWFGIISLCMTVVLLTVGQFQTTQAAPRVQEYWIKAEEILWDYAPSYPINVMSGKPFQTAPDVFLGKSSNRIGRIYRKAVYRSYTKDFGTIIDGPNEVIDPQTRAMKIIRSIGSPQEHLGLLGPTIRARVGDTIVVHFKNETRFPNSIHVHGFFYDKANEGTPYQDGTSAQSKKDDIILPSQEYTYTWQVPERAGPGPNDPSSIVWPYHSHVDEVRDTNAGLIGAIIVYKKGTKFNSTTNLPQDVDREFINLYKVIDENTSLFIEDNIKNFNQAPVNPEDHEFVESNLMHGINGLLYGNLKGLEMKQNDRVRWYLIGMGTEVDIHTAHWHGTTLLENGRRVDVSDIFPATVKTLDMVADNPGIWMYHCHVNDHIEGGMTTVFKISPRKSS